MKYILILLKHFLYLFCYSFYHLGYFIWNFKRSDKTYNDILEDLNIDENY